MKQLIQYRLARIVQLHHPLEAYDGWRINRRPPRVGDVGTIVDILRPSGLPAKYVLEACAADGTTIWLSDFDADEIEPAD